MKKVFFIAILGILSLILGAQVSFDSTAYQAFQKISRTYNMRDTSDSDILFWFCHNKVQISIDDQTKNLFFIEIPFEDILSTGQKTIRVQCKDDGGFLCVLSTGYLEKEKTNFISIEYNNILFFYKVIETIIPLEDELKPFKVSEDKGAFSVEEVDGLIQALNHLKAVSQPLRFW
jgi:hypothetical protein